MIAVLAEAIEELWLELQNRDRPVVMHRLAGPGQVELGRTIGSRVPADVATWFQLCNGVAYVPGQVQDDAALVPGYEPPSISEALAVKKSHGTPSLHLGEGWIPLLASGGGDFYAAVFGSTLDQPSVVKVMNNGDSRLAYRGIEDMVRTFSSLYRQGVFFVADDGILEADDEAWLQAELPN